MPDIHVHCNYPGGNIKVDAVKETEIQLEQDLRDTTEWWFYWNFCVENAQGSKLDFVFQNGEVIGPWGPAISMDGLNWDWLGADSMSHRSSFRYTFKDNENKVFFAFSLPYQVRHFEEFYAQYKEHPGLERSVLTQSEQGRPVPLLRLGNKKADRHIIFTCRHHACESTASYVLEGVLRYFLEHPESGIMKNGMIHCVPFVDLDGVENGDQGKARFPHDHNRDYIVKPVYRSTEAMMNYLRSMKLAVGIDFHSPWKWGERNDHLFFVKRHSPVKEEIEKLGDLLKEITSAGGSGDRIIHEAIYDVEANQEWNKSGAPTASNYFEQCGAQLAMTMEVPYFGIDGTVYTQKNCREFGTDLAKALDLYFTES